jgi:hypothetical protein
MEFSFIEVIRQTLLVSGFVFFMLMIIEYVNVRTRGRIEQRLSGSKSGNIFLSTFLGSLPGCMGTFAVVSLFTHNLTGFSGLIAASIATFGDEAFILFGSAPVEALILTGILAAIAIITGFVFSVFEKKRNPSKFPLHLETHESDCHCHPKKAPLKHHLQKISMPRAFLIAILLLILLSQFLTPGHEAETCDHADHVHEAVHAHTHGILSPEVLVFMGIGLFILFIVMTVPEHFLTEHLWGHVLKKHFLPIFLWTLGSILVISLSLSYFDVEHWIGENLHYVYFLAILIGFIPISGPHLVFITLFTQGAVPFSVLLVNSLVQEGHGGLPLLAESKRDFIKMKAVKTILAIIVIGLAYAFHF